MSDIEIIVDETEEGYVPPGEVFPSDEERDEVSSWLLSEFTRAEDEQKERRDMWARWRRQRMARPEKKVQDYPWSGASNVVPPEAMSITNTAFAQVKGKYMNLEPLYEVKASDDKYREHANAMEALLNYAALNEDQMNMRKQNNTLIYDTVSLGTQFGKVIWDKDEVKYKRDGEEIVVTTHDGPAFIPIRLEDFLTRYNVTVTDRAPWYAVKTRYFEHELEAAVQRGFFTPQGVEGLLGTPITSLDENKQKEKEMQGENPDVGTGGDYLVYEVAVFWDVDGDGVKEDLRLWINPDSGMILREEYNDLGFRDVQRFPFLTVPYELYGLGMGWMCDQMQETLTTTYNMAINGAHLHSLQNFATRPGTDLATDEIRPMGVFEMDSPREDMVLINYPDVSAAATTMAQSAQSYIQRATGVNYAMQGLPDETMKSRFSPTGYQSQASTGSALLEINSKNFDEAYGEMGKKLFYLLIAHKDLTIKNLVPRLRAEDQRLVMEVLALREEDVRNLFAFSVKITPMDETEEAKQQKTMTLTQIYAAYIQQVLALLTQMNSPQLPPNVKEAIGAFVVGLTEMMQDTIEHMSELSTTTMLPFVDDLKLMLTMMDMQKSEQVAQAKEQISGMVGRAEGAVEQGAAMGAGQGNQGVAGQAAGPVQQGSNASPVSQSAPATGEIAVVG